MILLIVCILFILVLHCTFDEGYINKPPEDYPDPIQFYACTDSNTSHMGNNNYMLKKHGINLGLKGPYSYFLDIYDLRFDGSYHSPICENHYTSTKNNLTDPGILDYDNLHYQEKILEREKKIEKNSLVNPNELFVSNESIGNKLTYKPEVNKLFLKNHRSHDDEQLTSRLNNKHVPDDYFNA